MNSRRKSGQRLFSEKSPKDAKSFNFFRGCNTSARPDWGLEVTRFKVIRRRLGAPV
jgi:hypothetical protein